ncbi:hypothetical protein SAMN05421771_0811 [Granulicella pectinivorans]|uniref:Uncharacterized protein n=1 Tax=Granulicella pectinivorans TaxID=474950 RepID=A0A1I6LJZ1_9BACT|nr:hypothetical protein [Granulicella pectinivorans]SFS03779.1 hypothetical protein SAMN05421771_0811 [Granulicella pectinivorans]
MKRMMMMVLLGGLAMSAQAQMRKGLCMLSVSEGKVQQADLVLRRNECSDSEHGSCGTSENSNLAWSRWSGVSASQLGQEGAQLKAAMSGEPGQLVCTGTVHDGILAGRYEFTPNPTFLASMGALGFDDISPSKQEGFLLLDITTDWVKQIKAAGVTELSTGKIMGLRALHVDLDYIHGMAAAGYPELRAGKLTSMKAVGVTPEKVRDAKAMGFQPTEEELIQMSVFKIDRPFLERMKARGMGNATIAQLIKIKIFKLED